MRNNRFQLNPSYKTSKALVIGIDHYLHAPPLGYAVSDASAIEDFKTMKMFGAL